jgi:peptidase M48-like protein
MVAACSDPTVSAIAHDPCAPIAIRPSAPTDVERTGITDALALWRGRGVTALAMVDVAPAPPSGATITVRFEDAGATFHGIYDPASASVLINRDLTRAAADRAALAVVIAHELGHVFGLVHIDAGARISLMNPGNLVTPPTEADQQALEALWGACTSGPAQ